MSIIKKISMSPSDCGLDLGDGSERAEYVNQDYILQTLGKPHRYIGIMYTYYPKDKQWPARISEACKDMEIHFQWDYPYDDYAPYHGGLNGNPDAEVFKQIEDIRRHGQDVTLTLTIDCACEDEYLRAIAQDLKKYGRMRFRINHECGGDWFTHSKRYSRKEVGEFFARFAKILREEAPNVQTIFCGPDIDESANPPKLKYEEDFAPAVRASHLWSSDLYLALHYGWPYDVCETESNSYCTKPVSQFLPAIKAASDRATEINDGVRRKLIISEFNTDGDVTGPKHQGEAMRRLIETVKKEDAGWFDGFSLYQFRDRGRLGLEIEDPNNKSVGIPQPLIEDYKEFINDPFFLPKETVGEELSFPVKMRWGGSQDADGFVLPLTLEKDPEFFEITFADEDIDANLMMEVGGRWFYKAPGVKTIDFMSGYFTKKVTPGEDASIKFFAPPASGQNDPSQGEDWDVNYYSVMHAEPSVRVRYTPVKEVEE